MGIGKMFFKRMLVLVLTVVMTASVIPMTVMADGGNTYQQATSVTFGQKYSGSMSKTNDTDWYAKNETIKIDGKNYNFNASGYCTNP